MALLRPQVELEGLTSHETPALEADLLTATEAILHGNLRGERAALRRVGETVAATQGIADLLGRRRVLLELDHLHGRPSSRRPYSAAYAVTSVFTPLVPHVPFREAVADILARDPRLAQGAAEVSALYGEDYVFAVARSTDLVLTRRVQNAIARVIREGTDRDREEAVMEAAPRWTRAYSSTVFRTSVSTAYSGGRFAQARDPDVSEVIVGLRRVAVLDSDCRANHRLAHGWYAATNDPAWGYMAPPWGYNERCGVELIDRFRAAREGILVQGRIPPQRPVSGPDPGFRVHARAPGPAGYSALVDFALRG